jgi:hypothetical protein
MTRSTMYSLHAHAVRGEVGLITWHLTRSIHEVGGRGHIGTVLAGEIRLAGTEDAREALRAVLLDAAEALLVG